jgi:PAS domain S-box-containing protein
MDKFINQEKELYKIIATDSLLSNLPGHIYWKNKKGIFLGCNDEHAKYFGLNDPNDIIGKTNFDLMNKENAIKITEADNKVIETGKAYVTEELVRDSQCFLSKKIPLKDFKGEIVGVLGTSIDVTEQKKLEINLKQHVHKLAVALEAKERFLRNISHEIRTPLQSILSLPETLKENYDSFTDQERKKCIDLLVISNKRLVNLMSNLLDLSKFRDGKFLMDFKEENLENTVNNIINEFNTHGKIFLNIEKDVVKNCTYDDFRITQVIRNLIQNSIKYGSSEKPICINISKYKDFSKHYIKLTVTDSGIGIPVEERATIFEAFVEGSKTQSFAGGTGLGLSIAKEIVEAHRGKIWVEDSVAKEGTSISFTIQLL